MILTGNQIKWAREHGYLSISDWDEKRLNPNSYNLRLADELIVYSYPLPSLDERKYYVRSMDAILTHKQLYEEYLQKRVSETEYYQILESYRKRYSSLSDPIVLDMKENMETYSFKIPKEGHTLLPGVLYLGRTMEYTETHKFVPMLEGRSSVGRLGISVHSTAGFGDIGFSGYWTLEISCVQPIRIYPGVEICQIYYHTIAPDCDIWIPDDDNKNIMKYEDGGKYQKNSGIQPSMMWKEFEK